MVHKTSGLIELNVPAKVVWDVLTKDIVELFPKLMPNIFSSINVVEGDGGVGTIFLFNFGEGVHGSHGRITYQKERVTEKDDDKHIIAMEVMEGGHRQKGFSYNKTRLEMKEDKGKSSCEVDCSVEYETANGEPATTLTIESVVEVCKSIENHLLSY